VDNTTWPVNLAPLAWKLRYAPHTLSDSEHLILASAVDAYCHLIDPSCRQYTADAMLRRARLAQRNAPEIEW